MCSMDDKIYLIGAFESIINGKTYTDFGEYRFEYLLHDVVYNNDSDIEKTCTIGVKVRNTLTNKLVYLNAFSKLTNFGISELLNSTIEDKTTFIISEERKSEHKMYKIHDFFPSSSFYSETVYNDIVIQNILLSNVIDKGLSGVTETVKEKLEKLDGKNSNIRF